ncbi:MAG: ATP-binding protein [Candidatus Baldrarchaeia archaeon]
MPYKIVPLYSKCIGCGDCVTACPINAIGKRTARADMVTLRVRNGKVEVVNEELCDGCGVCIEACPTKAIKIEFVQ